MCIVNVFLIEQDLTQDQQARGLPTYFMAMLIACISQLLVTTGKYTPEIGLFVLWLQLAMWCLYSAINALVYLSCNGRTMGDLWAGTRCVPHPSPGLPEITLQPLSVGRALLLTVPWTSWALKMMLLMVLGFSCSMFHDLLFAAYVLVMLVWWICGAWCCGGGGVEVESIDRIQAPTTSA